MFSDPFTGWFGYVCTAIAVSCLVGGPVLITILRKWDQHHSK